jgi:hypothetical protein
VSQDNTAQWPPPPPPYGPPPPYQPPPPRGGRRLVGAWQLEVGSAHSSSASLSARAAPVRPRRPIPLPGPPRRVTPIDGRRDGHGTASIARCSRHRCDGGGEQSTDLVSSSDQPDARVWRRLGGGHHRQERVDEHRQDGPPGARSPSGGHQPVQAGPPSVRVYAARCGHRKIVCSPHTCGSSSGGCATSRANTPKITKSGWSTTRRLRRTAPGRGACCVSGLQPTARRSWRRRRAPLRSSLRPRHRPPPPMRPRSDPTDTNVAADRSSPGGSRYHALTVASLPSPNERSRGE